MQKNNSKNKQRYSESYATLATFFGIGNIKKAPGTFGSLAALPLWILYNNFFEFISMPILVIDLFWLSFLLLLFFVGAKAANIYSSKTKTQDSSSIVIDEVLGQLIVLLLSYHLASEYIYYSSNPIIDYPGYIALSFVLFRFFDIFKPSFIGRADKKFKGGYGVMFDDVLAGFAAAASLNLLIVILIFFI